MDITIGDAAERLGTSIPRVRRAIDRLGIVTRSMATRDGRPPRVLDEEGFQRLRDELGSMPAHALRGREELKVLAAFNMNPFGFRSRRAVAITAGISPTTASAIVDRLLEQGLVVAVPALLRNSGRVIRGMILEANRTNTTWSEILDDVLATHLPVPRMTSTAKIVPRRFWHLFWNAQPAQLPIIEHADFIASRMLLSKDPLAVSWAMTHLPASSIEKTASLRQVNDSDRQWLLGLSRARREALDA
ncbi:MAG: MarR family transcriptional regulator [Acidobacteria bacterium]|nr:MarR family transcriptional regulator [Acidobacteriota bacterium]